MNYQTSGYINAAPAQSASSYSGSGSMLSGAGVCKTAMDPRPSNMLESMRDSALNALTQIQDLTSDLRQIGDHALGVAPEANGAGGLSQPSSGAVHQLGDVLGLIHSAIDDLRNQVVRLRAL